MGLTAIYRVDNLGCSGCEMTSSPLFYGKYELGKRFFHRPNPQPRCRGECGGSTPPAGPDRSGVLCGPFSQRLRCSCCLRVGV